MPRSRRLFAAIAIGAVIREHPRPDPHAADAPAAAAGALWQAACIGAPDATPLDD